MEYVLIFVKLEMLIIIVNVPQNIIILILVFVSLQLILIQNLMK